MDFSYNDVLENVDLNNMLLGSKNWGIISGLAVSQRGAGANMSVDVALGECFVDGTTYTESGTTNVVITAADATHARKDLIVYDTATSAPIAIAGSPAATPQPPDITASDILLALVDVAANDTSIVDAEITDKRIVIDTYIPVYIIASDVLLHSNDTERSRAQITYGKMKEIRIPARVAKDSRYRVKFDMKVDAGSGAAQIYLNGTIDGTEQTTASTSYVTKSEDLLVFIGGGDLLQIYGKNGSGDTVFIQNFRLYGDETIDVDYANTAGY